MTDRWQQIEKLYHSALELDESQRKPFLDRACSGDEDLRREVESLLSRQRSAEQFFEAPAIQVGAKVMGRTPPQSLVGAAWAWSTRHAIHGWRQQNSPLRLY